MNCSDVDGFNSITPNKDIPDPVLSIEFKSIVYPDANCEETYLGSKWNIVINECISGHDATGMLELHDLNIPIIFLNHIKDPIYDDSTLIIRMFRNLPESIANMEYKIYHVKFSVINFHVGDRNNNARFIVHFVGLDPTEFEYFNNMEKP
jgi:hypothetical protein